MATLDEILAAMPEEGVTAAVTDEVLVIDPNTRQISIPSAELTFGVEGDAGSERKYFLCPRYVGDNVDLASCFIRVNYRNANGDMDEYLVNDVVVDGDNVVFSWELNGKAIKYKGQTRFVVCAIGPDTKLAWHTTQATGLVLAGLEPDNSHVVEGTSDVVAQLIGMVNAQTTAVEAEGATQVQTVKTAAKAAEAASVAEIEAKGVNTLASIPDDYTALSEAVTAIERGMAPGIVCEAAGETVVVSDASNQALRGLRIFGRSTQDGVPSPDAPVEIKSVEDPEIKVCGKNMVKHETKSQQVNGITFITNSDGSITANGTATENAVFILSGSRTKVPAGTYVLSGCPKGGSYTTYAMACTELGIDYGDGIVKTFEEETTLETFYPVIYKGVTVDNITFYPMLEVASIKSDSYEKYKEAQSLSVLYILHGIPVTSGGNYTDSDGQQWICDEVNLERGVYVQRVEAFTVTGNENWTEHASGRFYAQIKTRDTYLNKFVLCSHVTHSASSGRGLYGSVGSRGVYFNKNEFYETLDDLIVFLKANSVVFVAVLATPIETPLSETELAAYRALHTNKPNTTILNDQGAHMAVAYTADTKLYIDNKIKEVLG